MPLQPVTTYDPALNVLSFLGNLFPLGYAAGTFMKASRTEDSFTTVIGAGGQVVRVKSNNRSGEVEFTLLAASQANDVLSAIAAQDELLGTQVGPLFIQEINGTTVVHADQAWIKKRPDIERAKEQGEVTWVLACADIEIAPGGLL